MFVFDYYCLVQLMHATLRFHVITSKLDSAFCIWQDHSRVYACVLCIHSLKSDPFG